MKDTHYLKIYFGVFKMKQLKLSSKVLYSFLNYLSQIDNPVRVRNSFLAEQLDISLDTVKRSLNELKNAKLIETKNTNRYRTIEVKKLDFTDYLQNFLKEYNLEQKIVLTQKENDMLERIYNSL